MQYPFNRPIGAQESAAITTNTTTTINSGSGTVLSGYTCSSAGSSWTVEFYNGDPAGSGVAIGAAITPVVGINAFPLVACPAGLYVKTAGTTAGSLKALYF